MTVSDRIYEQAKKLPERLQAELLDFVHHLASKVEGEGASERELASSSFSLSLAMRGMENEDVPTYEM